MRRWTKYEVDIISSQYGKIKNSELAQMIDRSVESLQAKAKDMGITNQDHSQKIKKSKQDHHMKASITVRPMTALEHIPQLPGLLDHLVSMSGCMNANTQTRALKARKEGTQERWALIKRMLDSGMTGHAIAHETGISKGTIYWHIREMRAAA